MSKQKTVYSCSECGANFPKWMGRCTACDTYGSVAEEIAAPAAGDRPQLERQSTAVPFLEIKSEEVPRFATGDAELDRVLGGGLVRGAIVLIGGDPGIGKSTLLLQTMNSIATSFGRVLYVSGEESSSQTKLRGERLGIKTNDVFVLAETNLERIESQLDKVSPAVLVIDSIQTVYTSTLESAPGSVGQVRECAARLMLIGKSRNMAIFIVGHVTKDGSIAGPRVLEHIVDTVLYFEGDPGHPIRILRGVKNRFGSTSEVGVFEMRQEGLAAVSNPSELFLAERPVDTPGSAVCPTMQGARPLLVELQALVADSSLANPRRTAIGIDNQRLALLVAILEKRLGMNLSKHDVYLNAAGGLKLTEPAADLACICAVASSYLDRIIDPTCIILGEVGLAGEVRSVTNPEQRVIEAARLGFTRCLLPDGSAAVVSAPAGMTLKSVSTVNDAIIELFEGVVKVKQKTLSDNNTDGGSNNDN